MQKQGPSLAQQLIEECINTKNPVLDLGNCGLNNNSPELKLLEKCGHLEVLDLGNKKVKKLLKIEPNGSYSPNIFLSIPKVIESLTNLTDLAFEACNIERIENLDNCLGLTHLNLSSNTIRRIENISLLHNLKNLNLGYNEIQKIEGLTNCRHLETLILETNEIHKIEKLETLSNLSSLVLGYNDISKIENLDKLKNLRVLDLQFNNITKIENLSTLLKLENLILSVNEIQKIENLENLTNIRHVDLENNQISIIENINHFESHVELNLTENPIRNCPVDIYESGNISLIKGYFQQFENQKVKSTETKMSQVDELYNESSQIAEISSNITRTKDIKLILLGNSNSGKTTLVQFLKTGEFLETRDSTHGLSVIRWEPDAKRFPELKDVSVSIWDFGGQEYYHETYKVFISSNAVFLTVWSEDTDKNGYSLQPIKNGVEEEIAHFTKDYWLNAVRYYSSDAVQSPLFLVQTKIDKEGHNKLRVSQELHEEYKITESFHLGLKEGIENEQSDENRQLQHFIKELEHFLKKHADKAEHVDTFLQVRNTLLNEKSADYELFKRHLKNDLWIDRTHFAKACSELTNGGIDIKLAAELPNWLNRCGVVNWKDTDKLRDKVFINPKNLSDKIWQLCHDNIRQNKGVLNIVNADSTQKVLVDLLKKMDLIFDNPDDSIPNSYIVPQYLPEKHPVEYLFNLVDNSGWKDSFWIRVPMFYYKKVLSKLMFVYADNAEETPFFWKHGVLFANGGCRVLIKGLYPHEFENDGVIQVTVEDSPIMGIIIDDIVKEVLSCLKTSEFDNIDVYLKKMNPKMRKEHKYEEAYEKSLKHPTMLISYNGKDFVDYQKLIEFEQNDAIEKEIETIENKLISIKPFSAIVNIRIPSKKVFLSYSHKNTQWLNRLRVHLAGLKHSNLIETWTDQEILPGEKWDERIMDNIKESDVFILLLSADFVASNYIWSKELPTIKQTIEKKGGSVIYVLCEPFDISAVSEISEKEIIPKNESEHLLAVSLWENHELALQKVAEKIRHVITSI